MMAHYVEKYWDSPALSSRLGGLPIAGTYRAFIPDPIATSNPQLSATTVQRLSTAERALERLCASPEAQTVASLLAEVEALGSSAIESIHVPYLDLAQALLLGPGKNERARLVLGNLMATEEACALAREPEITVAGMTRIHRALLAGTYEDRIAGRIRREEVWIGGLTPVQAMFVPPPAEYLDGLLDDLVVYLNRSDLPPVAQAAIAHAQYETVHPYADGNGRSGRALIHTVLVRHGLEDHVVAPLSAALFRERPAYYRGLQRYREARLDEWCQFVAEAITHAAQVVIENPSYSLVAGIQGIRARWSEQMGPARRHSASARLLPQLLSSPLLNLRQARHLAGSSPEATRLALQSLQEAGILNPAASPNQRRLWAAPDVLILTDALLGTFRLTGRGHLDRSL